MIGFMSVLIMAAMWYVASCASNRQRQAERTARYATIENHTSTLEQE